MPPMYPSWEVVKSSQPPFVCYTLLSLLDVVLWNIFTCVKSNCPEVAVDGIYRVLNRTDVFEESQVAGTTNVCCKSLFSCKQIFGFTADLYTGVQSFPQ